MYKILDVISNDRWLCIKKYECLGKSRWFKTKRIKS